MELTHLEQQWGPDLTKRDVLAYDADVVRAAQLLHDALAALGLESHTKTTGGDGLHVQIPVARRHTYDDARAFCRLVARAAEVASAGLVTTDTRRDDAVFVDAKMNGHGQQLVSVYSVRPLEAPSVATPLGWDEVVEGLDPRAFSRCVTHSRGTHGSDGYSLASSTMHDDRQHPNVTFAVLALGGTAYSLLQSLVVPALPDIQHALHTSESSVSWVLTAYLLSASVATPLIGRLGDMYGKERLLVIVLALLCVGTLISALAGSLGVMLIGRVVQGAAGGIFPLAFGIIRDEFPRERVAGAIGIMSALMGIGGGAGVVLTGPIVAHLDYHWLFWLPLVLIVAATVLTHVLVPESPIRVPGRVNYLGAALMTIGLVVVLVAVSETPSWHWLSAKTLGCIAAGIVVLALWVWNETRAAEPLVDMRMMRIRGVWTTNAVALLLGFGMYASFILIPQYVQTPKSAGYGFASSVTQAGLFLVPSTVAMLLLGSQTGRLERLFGSKPPLLAGGVLAFLSFTLLTFARSARWEVYVASALLGAGIGLAFAAMANLIIENVGPGETGVATGMNTVTRTIGGAFGGAATASLLAGTVGSSGYPSAHGYTGAFGFCAGALFVGVLVGLVIPQRRPEQAFEPHAVGDLA